MKPTSKPSKGATTHKPLPPLNPKLVLALYRRERKALTQRIRRERKRRALRAS